MRKFLLFITVVLVLGMFAVAQDQPKGEVSFGYAYTAERLHPDLSSVNLDRLNNNGWYAEFGYKVVPHIALTGEVNGGYSTATVQDVNIANHKLHTFLAGPRFDITEGKKVTPFAKVLVGVARTNWDATETAKEVAQDLLGASSFADTKFAVQFGGGVDVNVTKRVAVRSELGWLHVAQYKINDVETDQKQDHLRFSTGLVLHF